MLGSVVIIFPTPHEGGALVLRHENNEFTFDAAALLSRRNNSIAYVAFFSDVEHEVMPVVSGHRITLTYNLYFRARRNTTSPNSLEVLRPAYGRVPAVRDALYTLLDDPTFMPSGGTLGFGLRHHYPFSENWTENMEDPLVSLEKWLKGGDAALFQACSELGLSLELRLISTELEGEIMLRYMVELGSHVEDAESKLFDDADGVLVRSFVFTGDATDPWYDAHNAERQDWHRTFYEEAPERRMVHWLTRGRVEFSSPYAAYGNEAALEWLYMHVGLLVTIRPHGRRTEEPEVEEVVEGESNGDGFSDLM